MVPGLRSSRARHVRLRWLKLRLRQRSDLRRAVYPGHSHGQYPGPRRGPFARSRLAERCSDFESGSFGLLSSRRWERHGVHRGRAPSSSKLMSSRVPVAAASRSSVRVEGRLRPLSSRAMTDWVVSIRCASCSCVSLFTVLVLHPSLVKLVPFGRGSISFARFRATWISRLGVFWVLFINTRTATTRFPTAVT